MRQLIMTAALLAHAVPGLAAQASDLQLDSLFQDHMVLPRQGAVVSGRAAAREAVTVSGFGGSWKTSADGAGRFSVTLPSLPAGQRGSLAVSSARGQRVTLQDVVSGDVFLCSGQSNMQLSVNRALNADTVIGTSSNPDLRMATVAVDPVPAPRTRLAKPVVWQAAAPGTIKDWSATCYFFGKELQRRLKLPIGLVHASLGGSNLTAWLSPAASLPDYARQQELLKLYASDPAAASIAFGKEVERWWQASNGPGRPWSAAAAELASWKPAPDVARNWENWGLPELSGYDGSIWYAASARLTPAQARQAATLELGLVDEVDTTWVNGQPVGFTAGAGTPRAYPVAAGMLKAGDNTVVLNVLDLWSYGGMYGDAPRRLRFADGSVAPLTGWRWQMPPAANRYPPRAPWDAMAGVSVLHNGMIAPLGRFPFKGALWYQGESNVGSPYQGLLARLFRDWRSQFGEDMAFGVVQLANFGARPAQPVESGWARLREEQRRAVLADRNAVLATAIDVGDPGDIHPANKQVVGERLARAFAIRLYGEPGSASGPMVKSATVQGERVLVEFDGVDGALLAYGAAGPIGFEACTASGCRWVEARAAGSQVVLSAAADAERIRYCWGDSPTCTLYDGKSGLPAVPFEQDVKR
ncbi:hypothetical protein LK542_17355 [Massilia sp. IC2-477]|uniref:sialate O-acetylesterase n=1 Tax=Massilia sp. IC2-477 TaxID=2887198 RepID=UPI001D11D7A5|nr:sialate O-acetylesterase [Massilia sp. IC2-477]MCC2957386.1 hypothetical protein [Massilia sp. IC2-477]